KVVEENPQVLQPAFQLQRCIRRKYIGVRYWEKMARHRKEIFAGYDESQQTSWEVIESIITAKRREREEEEERRRVDAAQKHEEEVEKEKENWRIRDEEQYLRKIENLTKLQNAQLPEEAAEERAWVALNEVREEMESDFTEDRLEEMRATRERLWDYYEEATSASQGRLQMQLARATELATADDAQSKADAWIVTKQQGAAKYSFLCQQSYGHLLHAKYTQRAGDVGGTLFLALASLHSTGNGPVTLTTRYILP
ncbi:unnamed protein product, partial [Choristocarpus tenellus]